MKKNLLTALLAVVALFTVSSCVNEAPEINYSVQYTHTSDFTSLIKAINDQTLSFSEKLELVAKAVDDGAATLEQASDALAQLVSKAINDQGTALSEKLDILNQAMDSQNILLEEKLNLLCQALNNGAITLENALHSFEETVDSSIAGHADITSEAIEDLANTLSSSIRQGVFTLGQALWAINGSVNSQTLALSIQLSLINRSIASGAADITEALNEFMSLMDEDIWYLIDATEDQTQAIDNLASAVVEAIDNGVTTLQDALEAIADAEIKENELLEYWGDVISTAIEKNTVSIEDASDALVAAIGDFLDAHTDKIDEILQGLGALEGILGEYYPALIEAVQNLEVCQCNGGEQQESRVLYTLPDNPYQVFMDIPTYNSIMESPDPESEFLALMTEFDRVIKYPPLTIVYHPSMSFANDQASSTRRPSANAAVGYHFYDYINPDEGFREEKGIFFYYTSLDLELTAFNCNYRQNMFSPLQCRTIRYSTDGGTNWSEPVEYSWWDAYYPPKGTAKYTISGITFSSYSPKVLDIEYAM